MARRRAMVNDDMSLLRYVLGVDRQQPLARTQRQIWFVVQELIAGQIEFETAALAAGARWQKIQLDPAVSRARTDAWIELLRTVPRPFALVPG